MAITLSQINRNHRRVEDKIDLLARLVFEIILDRDLDDPFQEEFKELFGVA